MRGGSDRVGDTQRTSKAVRAPGAGRLPLWLAPGLALALSGCASVYLNDADLAKKTDSADAAVQAADTLRPYATELASIDAFSAQQDQAVAARDVAQRDDFFASHLVEDAATLLSSLDKDACKRLKGLLGPQGCGSARAAETLQNLRTRMVGYQRLAIEDQASVAATRAAYERLRAPGDSAPDDCDSALRKPPPAGMTPAVSNAFQDVKSDCTALAVPQDGLARTLAAAALDPASALGQAESEASAAIARTTAAGVNDAALRQAISDAAALSASGNLADLKALQDKLGDVFKYATPAARIAGLTSVQTRLDQIQTGLICAPGSAVAKCTAVAAASTSGRTAAVWAGLEALAHYFDANDPRYRSATWLAAANAILAAEKADARLQAQAAKETAALASARADRLWRATKYLEQVHQIVRDPSGPAVRTICPDTPAAFCALAADLDAWNYGLIPDGILQARESLVFARASVRRQLAAQTEQQALARAASASLKNYADGGIPPAVIAQLLVDLGLTAAVAAK